VSRRGALSPRAKPLIQTGGCSSEYPTFKAPLGVGGISENQFPRKFSQRQFGSIPICTDRSKNNHTIGDKTRSTTGILAVKGLVDRARRSWYLIMCGNTETNTRPSSGSRRDRKRVDRPGLFPDPPAALRADTGTCDTIDFRRPGRNSGS
jgi:hypothetical protein